MKRNIVLKGIALINFAVLLMVFLLYRNGSFDQFISTNDPEAKLTSPNGGAPVEAERDTIPESDSIRNLRLSSSKSIIITDDLLKKNSSKNSKKDSIKLNFLSKDKRLLYSTKSGIIIEPKTIRKIKPIDSLKTDKKKE